MRRLTVVAIACVLGCGAPGMSPRVRAATSRFTLPAQDFWGTLDPNASSYTVEWALATLSDDNARGEEWAVASHVLASDQMLASRGDSLGTAGYSRRSREAVPFAPRSWNTASLHQLAARRITELLATRGTMRAEMSRLRAAIIVLSLAELGPSISLLRATSQQWRRHSTEDPLTARAAAILYELRDISGDRTALGEYLDWLPQLREQAASEAAESVLDLAVDHRDDPAVVRVFDRIVQSGFWGIPPHLFADRLYQSRVMGLAPMRQYFITRLRDRSTIGELVIEGRDAIVWSSGVRLFMTQLSAPLSRPRSPWRSADDTLARCHAARRTELVQSTPEQRDVIIAAEIARLAAPDRGQWEPAPQVVIARQVNTP